MSRLVSMLFGGFAPAPKWRRPRQLVEPALLEGEFLCGDGARLPIRRWLPAEAPQGVILAVHGMNEDVGEWIRRPYHPTVSVSLLR